MPWLPSWKIRAFMFGWYYNVLFSTDHLVLIRIEAFLKMLIALFGDEGIVS